MLPKDVLEDICWPLARRDLEALLLTDHTFSSVVTDSFASTGPLRLISHATLNDDGLKCQSGDEEKVIENPKDYGACLRNTVVYQLSFNCNKELSAAAIKSLQGVKGKYLLKSLQLGGTTTGALAVLKSDVFTCEKLSYEFDYYPYDDESEEEGNDGEEADDNGKEKRNDGAEERNDGEEKADEGEEEGNDDDGSEGDDGSKDVPRRKWSPAEITAAFFNSNTVKQASCLRLNDMWPCDVELIAEWLHYGNGQPRSMNIWWECGGEDELDSVKLIKIVKERFIEATSPQQYEFYAGAERFDSCDIDNAYLENSGGEFLEIEPIRTCYSEVRITRLPQVVAQPLQIVATMEGPKVWDFHTVDALEAYLARNSLMDLLARSGLIANQVQCKCGHPMHLRQKSLIANQVQCKCGRPMHKCDLIQPEVAVADRFQWRCSGSCYNMYGQRFTATVRAGSWYKAEFWRWYWAELDFYVKLVILVASGADKSKIAEALQVKETFVEDNGGLATFKEKYDGIWGDGNDHDKGESVGDVIKRFYEKVREKFPLNGTYQLPENYSQW